MSEANTPLALARRLRELAEVMDGTTCPDTAALLRRAADALAGLGAERDKLQAYKDWTHSYLDSHGVPHHPPGTHGAEGCRIGDRMDWLLARLAAAEAKCAGMAAALGEIREAVRYGPPNAVPRLTQGQLLEFVDRTLGADPSPAASVLAAAGAWADWVDMGEPTGAGADDALLDAVRTWRGK